MVKYCIYFLINRKKVVYIGSTTDFNKRIYGHNGKIFTAVRVMYCTDKVSMLRYEKRWIKKSTPKYNYQHTKEETKVVRVPEALIPDIRREINNYLKSKTK
jgi:predicted GIY-YIG superfamily endonuclease